MKLKYLNHIDVFRAIAVLLVILFHLDIVLFSGGFIGVDLFFVISGFLITRLIGQEVDTTKNFSFKRFYTRRARRLLPSLFLVILLVFIFSFLLFSPSDFMSATQSMMMAAVALSNFFFLGETGYFDTAAHFKPLLHTWSLGIEEQFYLIWPLLLVFLLKKMAKKKLLVFVLILTGISFASNLYTSTYGISSSMLVSNTGNPLEATAIQFYLLPFRAFEFLIGGILVFIPTPKIKNEWIKIILHIIGLGVILLSSIYLTKSTNYLSAFNIIPCLGIALLLWIPAAKEFTLFYENKFLRLVGRASYTWYLFHWPMIVFYKYLVERSFNTIEILILFFGSLLLSLAIFTYYETPLRGREAKLSIKSNRTLIGSIGLFLLLLTGINWHVNQSDGWMWRLGEKKLSIIENIGNPRKYHVNNWGGAGYERGLIQADANEQSAIDMIWLGDSHCGQYASGVDAILVKKHGKNIHFANLMNPSALYLPDVLPTHIAYKNVNRILSKTQQLLKDHPRATLVLSHLWIEQMNRSVIVNERTGHKIRLTNDPRSFQLIAKKIEKLLNIVGQRNLIIIGSGPVKAKNELNYVEKLLKPKYLASLSPTSTTFRPNFHYLKINPFFEAYFKNKKNIYVIDPCQALCANNICLSQKDDKIFLSDKDHLSKDGAFAVIEFFESTFLSTLK